MTSFGEVEDSVDPNLENKSSPSLIHPSENLHERVVGNSHSMPPSEVTDLSTPIKYDLDFQEKSFVDGPSCSTLSFLKTSSVSNRPHQVDAVHPFFNGYRSVKYDKSTSTDNQVFYCRQCEMRIELCQEAVNHHFATERHTPIEQSCVYCNTAVYKYFYNENVCYFHRCPIESNQNKRNATVSSTIGLSSIASQNVQETVNSVSNKPTEQSCCDPF